VDVNLKDKGYGRTSLQLATTEGHEAVVKLLMKHDGVDVDWKDVDSRRQITTWIDAAQANSEVGPME